MSLFPSADSPSISNPKCVTSLKTCGPAGTFVPVTDTQTPFCIQIKKVRGHSCTCFIDYCGIQSCSQCDRIESTEGEG